MTDKLDTKADIYIANRTFTRQFYTFHEYPVLIDCNFVVDSTNGNGLGQRQLKGEGVVQVYMNTSAPLAGSGNPNPASGYIVLEFADNYTRYFSGFTGYIPPLSGSSSTSSISGVPNIIVSLGTATLAQWQAVGLPQGFTPTVGQSFIATSSALIGGSAAIEVPLASGAGIDHIEVVGDPNQTLHTTGYVKGVKGRAQIVLACYKSGVITAPAPGTVISLASYLSNSSNEVKGE